MADADKIFWEAEISFTEFGGTANIPRIPGSKFYFQVRDDDGFWTLWALPIKWLNSIKLRVKMSFVSAMASAELIKIGDTVEILTNGVRIGHAVILSQSPLDITSI